MGAKNLRTLNNTYNGIRWDTWSGQIIDIWVGNSHEGGTAYNIRFPKQGTLENALRQLYCFAPDLYQELCQIRPETIPTYAELRKHTKRLEQHRLKEEVKELEDRIKELKKRIITRKKLMRGVVDDI